MTSMAMGGGLRGWTRVKPNEFGPVVRHYEAKMRIGRGNILAAPRDRELRKASARHMTKKSLLASLRAILRGPPAVQGPTRKTEMSEEFAAGSLFPLWS